MPVSAVVFDLDQTLIATDPIESLRSARKWRECVNRLADTKPYEGVHELLVELERKQIPFAVVTSSVSFYASAVLRHHGICSPHLVAYHDTPMRKPHPAPVLRALTLMGIAASPNVIGLGDHQNDAAAYAAAGITSFGAGWSEALDGAASWQRVLSHPLDLLSFH